jgi:hypothetical protein
LIFNSNTTFDNNSFFGDGLFDGFDNLYGIIWSRKGI